MRVIERPVVLAGVVLAAVPVFLAVPHATAAAVESTFPPFGGVWPFLLFGTAVLVLSARYRLRSGMPPTWVAAAFIGVQLAVALPATGLLGQPTFVDLVAAATALVVLPDPWAWVWFAGIRALQLFAFGTGLPASALLVVCGYSLAVGLAVYAVARMAELAVTSRRAQAQMVRLALAGERLRVSRDLHDTLGQELAAVGLRAELAAKTLEAQPQLARAQLREIQAVTERTLTRVRDVARGDWTPAFADELDSARALLRASGVHCALRIDVSPPEPGEQAAGWAVREATTNVLKHSAARRCAITTERRDGRFVLVVDNDGVRAGGVPGAGLSGLAERVAKAGGHVHSGRQDRTHYRLVVELPD